jgi:hypothetical protein
LRVVKGLPFRVDYDYTADGVRRSIENSLQRLGMARIDFAYIHDCAEDEHGDRWPEVFDIAMKGAAGALTKLRDEGVIRAWALGVNRVEPCVMALERADPDVFLLAGRYSLLDHPALDVLFPRCAERGVHVVVGGPYNSGLLAGGRTFEYREAPPDKVAARDRLAAIATRHGVDLRAAALQFCAAHPVVASVIPGTNTPGRARERRTDGPAHPARPLAGTEARGRVAGNGADAGGMPGGMRETLSFPYARSRPGQNAGLAGGAREGTSSSRWGRSTAERATACSRLCSSRAAKDAPVPSCAMPTLSVAACRTPAGCPQGDSAQPRGHQARRVTSISAAAVC